MFITLPLVVDVVDDDDVCYFSLLFFRFGGCAVHVLGMDFFRHEIISAVLFGVTLQKKGTEEKEKDCT